MPTRVNLPDGRVVNFPDDMAQADIEKALGEIQGPSTAKPTRTWTDTAVDALPTLGGAVGGIVGGIGGTVAGMGVGGVPGALGGAALGGGAGEAARQLVNRYRGVDAPASAGEAAGGIAKEGAIQGAAELAGAGIGKALGAVGGRLYSAALRPSAAIKTGFGDVAGFGLKEGRLVSPGGAAKVAASRGASSQAADQLVAKAAEDGIGNVPTSTVTSGFQRVGADAAKRASLGMADDTADVLARGESIAGNYPDGIPLTVAQSLKKAAQNAADNAFRTQQRGGIVRTVDAQLDKATATGLKSGLETAVTGLGEQNARTQKLIGLSKAMSAANNRNNTLSRWLIPGAIGAASGAAAGTPGALAGAALTGALMSPAGMSAAGITLDRVAGTPLSQEAIRAALFALMQKSHGE